MHIAVAGTGYVGLVTGVCLAEVGHNVICVDMDESKIISMKAGISPIYEQGLEQLLKKNLESGNLDFTTDYKKAYRDVDAILIGVGTPEKEDGSANLEHLYRVCEQIATSITKDCLVVIKSTVPIGTNEKIDEYFREVLNKEIKVEVASNPEFLAQGSAVKDTLNASRIVIGVESERAGETLHKIYEKFELPIVVTSRRNAEMIKYASNDFLALKISYMNEIANFCELIGANVDEVALGMSLDPRIGERFLNAGIGYGGSCFPKDTKALYWLGNEYGYEFKTIKATIEVNDSQKYRIYQQIRRRFQNLKGVKIAVLGLTFKPETDDLREAPSIVNVKQLLADGAILTAYDPAGTKNFRKLMSDENLCYANSPIDALQDAQIALIFTEWKDIKALTPNEFKKAMKNPIIYDGRNCYEVVSFIDTGVEYHSIGRKSVK
ncbi:MAG: UDP-glucose/GDP-mannose dehydrogenase family protein [Velocimicrobium sp.]